MTFTVPLKETESIEGQTVTLTCEVSKPNQTVKWFMDTKELKPDDRHQIVVEGTKHTLIINDVQLGEEAEYTATIAKETTSAPLWVEGRF